MGIINKIKEFLKQEKKEESEQKELQLQELENWLNERNTFIEKELKEKSKNIQNQITILIEKLEEETKILEKLDLKEKREGERIKQITELGKKDYIQAVEKLIQSLKDKKEIFNIPYEINKFAVSSAKSHYKATHLIGKEIENITNTIKEIRKLNENFLKENLELIKSSNLIKFLINTNLEMKRSKDSKHEIEEQIENIKKLIIKNQKEIDELEKEIKKMKESIEAKKREELVKEKIGIERDLKNLESKIKEIIDKRVLEKYLYLEKDKTKSNITQGYINDPITAILSDENLTFVEITKKIKEKITNKEILIKDSSKIVEKISLNKEILLQYKNNLLKMQKQIKDLEKEINKIQLKTPELENEKLRTEAKLEENNNHLEILLKKQEKIDSKIKEIFSNMASALMQQNVKLISKETF